MYIYSNTAADLLFVNTAAAPEAVIVRNAAGTPVACEVLATRATADGFCTTLDASNLEKWTPDTPVLYTVDADGETERFGHVTLRAHGNTEILLNDSPTYLRGYIRGIAAHEHPNMTGMSDYEAAKKNISQAKKYGFNYVRFHSTVPSEDFVRAADELGLFVHVEIGFAYDYDSEGKKQNLSMNNERWEETIMKYRNHPSIAVFCIGNEMHNSGKYPQVRALYELGKKLAPAKLIMDNAGWGEYDRPSADIYVQHIAYFFPYAHHKEMFKEDKPWRMNGSSYEVPLEDSGDTAAAAASAYRYCAPLRPTLSHEAMHYIDIPDYDAMKAKYEAFCEKVGPAYLEKHGISRPRYFDELPALIERKGLKDRMPAYREASTEWKRMAVKVFLEKLRLSQLCGYEMLQFADCLKYENKNGFVDFFDDDKNIDAAWLRQMNADLVMLADFEGDKTSLYEDETVAVDILASDFLPVPQIRGTLTVTLDGELLYEGREFTLTGGLQKLVRLTIAPKAKGVTRAAVLKAAFTADGVTVTNDWKLWFYPRVRPAAKPQLALGDTALRAYLAEGTQSSDLIVTDTLSDDVFASLKEGRTVALFYEYGAERNQWQLPGALERFKPCIWDRGSNLGGILANEAVKNALSDGKYFDLPMQPLLEAGWKVNLDTFPCAVEEHIQGIDKPVRDRMKSLLHGIKHFIDADTLRRFSHLFSVKVDAGLLIVCTFNMNAPAAPAASNLLKVLIDSPEVFATDKAISGDDLRAWIIATNEAGLPREDVMNHFWEIDNKAVEDTLFWEEAKVDLSRMRD